MIGFKFLVKGKIKSKHLFHRQSHFKGICKTPPFSYLIWKRHQGWVVRLVGRIGTDTEGGTAPPPFSPLKKGNAMTLH